MAKKIINQTVDIIGQLRLGSKKIKKPICSDFVFSKCQMLISKKITKPICSHFQCSVLISKKITEPICSDFVLNDEDYEECFVLFLLFCEMWDSWVQPVQRFAAGSLAMRSYSGMERQSAAATRVKKTTARFTWFRAWWIMVNPGDAW